MAIFLPNNFNPETIGVTFLDQDAPLDISSGSPLTKIDQWVQQSTETVSLQNPVTMTTFSAPLKAFNDSFPLASTEQQQSIENEIRLFSRFFNTFFESRYKQLEP